MGTKKITPTAKRKDMWELDPTECIVIGVDTEHAEGEHPLRETDDRMDTPLEEAFISSIEKKGVEISIGVRRSNEGSIEVIYGRRRVLATRIANERRLAKGETPHLVPAVLRRIDDKEAVEKMILENEQRRADTPLAKAKKLKIALKYGHTDASAAEAFGVSITAIRNWKKMNDLAPEVVHAIQTDEMRSSAAMDLAHLPKEEQVAELEILRKEKEKTGAKKITVKATTRNRRQNTGSKASTPFKPPKKKTISQLIRRSDTIGLSEETINAIKWLTGHAEADAVFGLTEALAELDKENAYKVTDAQQLVIDDLSTAPQLASDVNKKTMSALGKKGIVEAAKGDDGVDIIQLTEAYRKAMGIEISEEGDEGGESDSAA